MGRQNFDRRGQRTEANHVSGLQNESVGHSGIQTGDCHRVLEDIVIVEDVQRLGSFLETEPVVNYVAAAVIKALVPSEANLVGGCQYCVVR